jgi:hypothetical protein
LNDLKVHLSEGASQNNFMGSSSLVQQNINQNTIKGGGGGKNWNSDNI